MTDFIVSDRSDDDQNHGDGGGDHGSDNCIPEVFWRLGKGEWEHEKADDKDHVAEADVRAEVRVEHVLSVFGGKEDEDDCGSELSYLEDGRDEMTENGRRVQNPGVQLTQTSVQWLCVPSLDMACDSGPYTLDTTLEVSSSSQPTVSRYKYRLEQPSRVRRLRSGLQC